MAAGPKCTEKYLMMLNVCFFCFGMFFFLLLLKNTKLFAAKFSKKAVSIPIWYPSKVGNVHRNGNRPTFDGYQTEMETFFLKKLAANHFVFCNNEPIYFAVN